MTRAAARGKPFWHAERQGGPLWMQPQVLGRDKEDGRVADPEDIRVWTMTSFAGGATGVLNLRWRPLLDGPLFGAFGSYGMDGSRTPRSEMASRIAKWANAPEQKRAVATARPVQGDIGMLVSPEAQPFDYLLNHNHASTTYRRGDVGRVSRILRQRHPGRLGAYRRYRAARTPSIPPIPIMLTNEHAERLKRWVEKGGRLISEGCIAYFGDRGHVGVRQPNFGLDEVFGAREDEVEFMPDIGDRIRLTMDGNPIAGGGYLQSYQLAGGRERGRYADGRLAAVEHAFGAGRTLLVGTHPSIGYFRESGEPNRRYFADMFAWTGKTQHVWLSNPALQARLHKGAHEAFLWIINPTRRSEEATVRVGPHDGRLVADTVLWGDPRAIEGGRVSVPARDALVVRLLQQMA